jgi:hypothetical protein
MSYGNIHKNPGHFAGKSINCQLLSTDININSFISVKISWLLFINCLLEPLIFSTSTLGMGLLIEAGPEGVKYCECGTKVILILLE